MMQIRFIEHKIAAMRKMGHIGGPVHLGAGQEAIAVGISKYLTTADMVFGGHRSHAHVLAMGSSPYKLFAEVLGKANGLSKGMGGSMHLWDGPHGFHGSVPIVAGTVPLAVGAALALKMQNRKDIAVVYFGDGAIEEGVVHESLNLSRILEVPILFVCENNFFSSHMHISLRQPSDSTARFAIANNIPYKVVDGNDVIAVRKATDALISRARAGEGPVFLEAVTYRWYGHVDWREDIDVGVNRSEEEVSAWRKRDPISRLAEGLASFNLCSPDKLKEIQNFIQSQVAVAWQQAL
jgi:pyruvate dehydrogenase E1 component alpha subunit